MIPLAIAVLPSGANAAGHPANTYTSLVGVDAIGSNDVWAVGSQITSDAYLTYIQHYDGQAWQQVASPNRKGHNNFLSDVSGSGSDDVWAVGSSSGGADPQRAEIMHWDGASWSRVSSGFAATPSALDGVDVASSDDAWLVGTSDERSALSAHWNGHKWRRVPTPDPGADFAWAALYDVHVIAAKDVWAVGEARDQGGRRSYPLVEHWDGTAWTIADASYSDSGWLTGVTATSSDDVWAVGTKEVEGRVNTLPLLEHWDGRSWTVVDGPTIPGRRSRMEGVDAVAPNDVWAVGSRKTSDEPSKGGQTQVPITMHWDGSSWTLVEGSYAGHTPGLNDVSALATDDVWAAGSVGDGSGLHPLTAHWDGTSWQH